MSVTPSRSLLIRHAVLCCLFAICYYLLNRPEVILISRLGSVAWYPATGLVLALLLGINPWYAVLVAVCESVTGRLIYHQPITSFGETIGAVGTAACYAMAASLLRGPLKIDLGLRRRRDVGLYLLVTTTAAVLSTLSGTICLLADRAILWHEFWPSAFVWFIGDEIGLLGVAPFLLIHVLPWVRARLLLWAGRSNESHCVRKGGRVLLAGISGLIVAEQSHCYSRHRPHRLFTFFLVFRLFS